MPNFTRAEFLGLLGVARAAAAPEALGHEFAFSGYRWKKKYTIGSARVGPGPCRFSDSCASLDAQGRLRLAVVRDELGFSCGEAVLAESLGYGGYQWIIRVPPDADFDLNAVLGLFLWDASAVSGSVNHREIDLEFSRWGEAKGPNFQFVIQPYTKPANRIRFEIPRGRAVVSIEWSPGAVVCTAATGGRVVRRHQFEGGVPVPGAEAARMNLWMLGGRPPKRNKLEVLIEDFKFGKI